MKPMRNALSSTHDKITRSSWNWVIGACLVALTLLVYLPVWHAGFIMDDDINITGNACVSGPLGLGGIWSSRAADYFPLTLTSFWFLHALWGDSPLPYHLLTLLFHVADTLLLWRVLSCLDVRGAWIGASLWALHPAQVESVAWVSELKNTQSAFFFLLSILGFLHWRGMTQEGRRGEAIKAYALAILCALLAMLSKSSTVMLPAILVLCWWWREKNWRIRDTLQLAPFFLFSVAFALWTISSEKIHAGAVGKIWDAGALERFVMAGRAFWFYLAKLLWPQHLTFIYPRWEIAGGSLPSLFPFFTAFAALLLLWKRRRHPWSRAGFFAFATFTLLLFPILGFFDVAFFRLSRVADHFQYLACIGPLALGGAALSVLCKIPIQERLTMRVLPPYLLLVVLGWFSSGQSQIYQSAETLWRDTIEKNPDCAVAHNNLGFCFWQKGDRPNAVREVQTALALDPEFPDALNNLGNDSLDRGDPDTAISLLSKSVRIEPINASARYNLGNAFLQKGDFDRAIAEFQKALSINPHAAPIHSNLGCALIKKGDLAEGIKELQITRDLQPDNPVYNINLAWVLASCADSTLRNGPKALEYSTFAIRGGGTNPEYLRILAAAYAQVGLFQEAVKTATTALDLAQRNANPTLVQSLREELGIYNRKAPLP